VSANPEEWNMMRSKGEPKTVSVASRAHTSLHIVEPPEDPNKPALMPVGQSLVLHGASHPEATGGEMVTHNVDAKVFRRWHEHQKSINSQLAHLVREVPPDHEPAGAVFGFEPGMAALAASEDGKPSESTVTHPAPLESWELAATSDTPAEDTPRSEPDAYPTKRSQKSASQTITDELPKDAKK
jgi:hypothetical protein